MDYNTRQHSKINHKYQRKYGVVPVQLSPLDSEVYSTNSGDGSSGGAENSANDIDKGLSLSHMPTEKEELLFNMLGSNGEIKHIRDVPSLLALQPLLERKALANSFADVLFRRRR